MGLGLCCEEAARLILSHSTPAKLIKLSDDGGPEAETTEEHGFLEWREQLFGIAQDRGLTLTESVDQYTHTTQTRRKKESSSSSSG